MASPLTDRLVELLGRLEEIWKPFARPDGEWSSPTGLAALVDARDRSLVDAEPVLAEVRGGWGEWESHKPDEKERARVFSARNRLVELALEASRFEVSLETGLQRRIEEGRGRAAATTQKLRAATAYSRHVVRR